MRCHWPEIHKYYGCCNLRSGICVMSALIILIILMKILINVEFILHILAMSRNPAESEPDEIIVLIARTLLISSIMWSLIMFIQTFMLMLVIYGTAKRKSSILKAYLIVIIPVWAIEIVIGMIYSIVNFLTWDKILSLVSILVGGYHLLAINSEYKNIVGKAAIVLQESDEPFSMRPQHTPQRINQGNSLAPHCVTCVCYFNIYSEVPIDSPTIEAVPAPPYEPAPLQEPEPTESSSKDVNFKENLVIFDQNQLVEQHSPVIENRTITN